MTRKRRYFNALPVVPLCNPADLSVALAHAFPGIPGADGDADHDKLVAAAVAIDAAARAQLKRLADPKIIELDELESQIKAITDQARLLVEAFDAELKVDDEVITPVTRIASVTTPPTAIVAAIESGARAAGHDDPTQALNEALRQIVNLNLWAAAAAAAFSAGRSSREWPERLSHEDANRRSPVGAAVLALVGEIDHSPTDGKRRRRPLTTPAHKGRELGLVVIATYAALTGRLVRVSRRSPTKSQRGGEVTGPLIRFTLTAYEQIRDRLRREPALQPFGSARAFDPTPATIAAWAQEYNRSKNADGPLAC